VTNEPWRDPERYKTGKLVRCLGCGTDCHETHWGKWCYGCNVDRIERINRSFESLLR
jgi:hypothetical protein